MKKVPLGKNEVLSHARHEQNVKRNVLKATSQRRQVKGS